MCAHDSLIYGMPTVQAFRNQHIHQRTRLSTSLCLNGSLPLCTTIVWVKRCVRTTITAYSHTCTQRQAALMSVTVALALCRCRSQHAHKTNHLDYGSPAAQT